VAKRQPADEAADRCVAQRACDADEVELGSGLDGDLDESAHPAVDLQDRHTQVGSRCALHVRREPAVERVVVGLHVCGDPAVEHTPSRRNRVDRERITREQQRDQLAAGIATFDEIVGEDADVVIHAPA
jgi:hypothetical protein